MRLGPRSLATRLAIFFGLLLAMPGFLYLGFRSADAVRNALLSQAILVEGQLIATGLTPKLSTFQADASINLDDLVAAYGAHGFNVKLLFRPAQQPRSFFYMAASPPLEQIDIEAERRSLLDSGIFARLASSCAGEQPLAQRFINAAGQEELITSLTPIQLDNGCWVVLTSQQQPAYLRSSLDQPLWRTPAIQTVLLGYLVIAGLAAWLLFDVRADLNRLAGAARRMRTGREDTPGLASAMQIAELSDVAEELDRLLRALKSSQQMIRQAAEENAHALKTPIATIRQALEPLRTQALAKRDHDPDGARSVDLIDKATDRLDGLVNATRDLDQAAAESMDVDLQDLALSPFFSAFLQAYAPMADARRVSVHRELADDLLVRADPELLEAALEAVLENALSFSLPGSAVLVITAADNAWIFIHIADHGPGIAEADQERIFERYVSLRDSENRPPGAATKTTTLSANTAEEGHFGLGLWIARRNIEAMGGKISAAAQPGGGLRVTIALPRPV